MLSDKKWYSPFLFIPILILLQLLVFGVLHAIGITHNVPNNDTLPHWDVGWYNTIRLWGYFLNPGQQSDVAFFPLFPYVWRWLGLNFLGISLLNFSLALASMALLSKHFKMTLLEALLCFTLPSMFFLYVPYTESFFFFAASLLVVGISSNKTWLSIIGILIASFSRPSVMFLIPSIGALALYTLQPTKKGIAKAIGKFLLLVVPAITGFLAVIYIEKVQTGVWFVFFDAQKQWAHSFRLPGFPLTTWDSNRMMWLDGLAVWVGLLALVLCIVFFFRQFFKGFNDPEKQPDVYIFSSVFMAMAVLGSIFFYDYHPGGGTNILSINRYMFVNPFFTVFLLTNLRANTPTKYYKTLLLPLAIAVFFMAGFYIKLITAGGFLMSVCWVGLFLLWKQYPQKQFIPYLIIGFGLVAQMLLFDTFMSNIFVG